MSTSNDRPQVSRFACYTGTVVQDGDVNVDVDGEVLSIVVGRSDIHLIVTIPDWVILSNAVFQAISQQNMHREFRIEFDDSSGTAKAVAL